MVVRDIHILLEHHQAERICETPGDGDHLHALEHHHQSCVLSHLNFSEYFDLSQPRSEIRAPFLFRQLASSAIEAAPAAYTPVAQQRGPPSLLFPSL